MSALTAILAGLIVSSIQPSAPTLPQAPSPISGPTIISTSGSYIVTQDFTAYGEPAIKLAGAVEADIDFAGHTIAGNVIIRSNGDDLESRSLTMRNGHLVGATISAFPYRARTTKLCIDHLQLQGAGIDVEDVDTIVTASSIVNSWVSISNDYGGGFARVQGNHVVGGDIDIGGVGGVVQGNVVRNGSILVHGSDGLSGWSVLVSGNTVQGGNILVGTISNDSTSNVDIGRNTVSGYLVVNNTLYPWVHQNVIGGCSPNGASINVGSRDGSFEDNIFNGRCVYGIWFDFVSRGNTYAGNTFRTYVPVPYLDEGVDNVDGDDPVTLPD